MWSLVFARIRKHWPLIAFSWGTLLAAIGLWADFSGLGFLDFLRPQAQMAGDFRIAIAEFQVKGENTATSRIGQEVAEGVARRLQGGLAATETRMHIEVWGPEKVGRIKGSNGAARAQHAAEVAQRIEADVVVYGTMTLESPLWAVAPSFLVSDHSFYDAQELLGEHELGEPFQIPGQNRIVSSLEFGDEMIERVDLLRQITVGLAYYSIHDYAQAKEYFLSADKYASQSVPNGGQVLYILLGNSVGKLGDLEAAEAYYKEVIKMSPGYARAYVGLASVYYLKSLGSTVNVEMLERAIEAYRQASEASYQPPYSDITVKVQFGLGQCYLVAGLANIEPDLTEAIEEFQAVITAYGGGKNPRVRVLAAESHARLGLIYSELGALRDAVKEYDMAGNMLEDVPDRRTLYLQKAEQLRIKADQENLR